MPVSNYGLVKGHPRSWRLSGEQSLHAVIKLKVADHSLAEACINVVSQSTDSQVIYWINKRLQPSELLKQLSDLSHGIHKKSGNRFPALDLPRSNVAELGQAVMLPLTETRLSPKLSVELSKVLSAAVSHTAVLYIFGSIIADGTESMIHDIHMNQGNHGRFRSDDGTFQDGGILLEFPDGHWEAILIAFGSQAWDTDKAGQATGPDLRSLILPSKEKRMPKEEAESTQEREQIVEDEHLPWPNFSDCDDSDDSGDSEKQNSSGIRDETLTCQKLFHDCQKLPALSESDWIDKMTAEFNWWSLSMGAARSGRSSLDHRVKTREDLRDYILVLLKSLRISLKKFSRYAQPPEVQALGLQLNVAAAKEKLRDEALLSEEEYAEDLEFVEQVYYIEHTLKYLSRISNVVQEYETRLEYLQAGKMLDGELEAPRLENFRKDLHDLILLGPEQTQDDEALKNVKLNGCQTRLIRANLVRRSRFDHYLSLYRQKMMAEEVVEKTPGETRPAPYQKSFQQESRLEKPLTSATQLVSRSIISQESRELDTMPISAKTSQLLLEHDYPDCPASRDKAFLCPFCTQMLDSSYSDPTNNHRRWRGHVIEDLSPYICIYPECDDPDDMYTITDEWKKHMEKSHSVVRWICDICWMDSETPEDFEFDSEDTWMAHAKSEHSGEFDDTDLPDLMEESRRTVAPLVACPLCFGDELLLSPERDKHLSEHLLSFALQSLPQENFISEQQEPSPQKATSSSSKMTMRVDKIPIDQTSDLCHNLNAIVANNPILREVTNPSVCLSIAPRDKYYMCATVSFQTSLPHELFVELIRSDDGYPYQCDSNFYGITPLYDAQNGAEVDIVAIGGLMDDTLIAFQSMQGNEVWLRDFLPKDVSGIRVLLYGYNAFESPFSRVKTISDLATTFLEQINAFRAKDGTSRRPLIFIGHGLGSLIIKEALISVRTGTNIDNADISIASFGFLFFDVPNISFGKYPSNSNLPDPPNISFGNDPSNSNGPESLSTLERITEEFSNVFPNNHRVVTFSPRSPSPLEIDEDELWLRIYPLPRTVTETSAIVAGAEENNISLNSSQYCLVKYSSRRQDDYIVVVEHLKRLVDEAKRKNPKSSKYST